MPELPEVETVRRGLQPTLEGARLARIDLRRPDLRFPFPPRFVQRLEGRMVTALGRRAKYLLAELDDGHVLVMHLGMSGSFRVADHGQGAFHHPRSKLAAHDHVVFHTDRAATITYNDPRRFGFMTLVARADLDSHPHFHRMGLEPLGNTLSGPVLLDLFANKITSVKAALLDQRLVAGIGNIYACEALHRAALSPWRAAGSLSPDEAERLSHSIREVLEEAVAAGGSTLRDHAQPDGDLGYFQHSFRVYDREGAPCPVPGCTGRVDRHVQNGRSSFHCVTCQT